MKPPPRISESEWRLMKLLWRRSPQTAQELAQATAAEWSESTVKTLLTRLVRKGALRHRKEGKAFLYAPAITEEKARSAESSSFLRRVFDGSLSPMLAHFVAEHDLSEEELREIESLVKRKRRKP